MQFSKKFLNVVETIGGFMEFTAFSIENNSLNFGDFMEEDALSFIKSNFGRLSEREMAKHLDIGKTTVNRWCHKIGLMHVKDKVNDGYFKIWNPTMAYILGFIFADGNVNWKPSGSYWAMTITAAAKDKDHLEKIRVELESTKPLLHSKSTNSYRLIVNSKKMCLDLMVLGVVPKKSLVVDFPEVPVEFLSHVVRGIIDGDGDVRYVKRKRSPYFEITIASGSKKFIEKLSEKISSIGIVGKPRKAGQNIYILQYSCQRGLNLAKFVYGQGGLCLERKLMQYKKALRAGGVDCT